MGVILVAIGFALLFIALGLCAVIMLTLDTSGEDFIVPVFLCGFGGAALILAGIVVGVWQAT